MSKHCCDRMDYDLDQKCDVHPNRYDCPDNLVATARGGYGLVVHDGGSSIVEIAFCPWCGAKLSPIVKPVLDDDADLDAKAADQQI